MGCVCVCVCVCGGGVGESLKSERQRTGGGGSSLSLRSLCEKNAWFFKQQIESFLISWLAVAFQSLKVCTSHRSHQFFCLILFYISFWPMNCQCCSHMETSQLICTANRLTGFYVGATLAANELISGCHFSQLSRPSFSISWKKKSLKQIHSNPLPRNDQSLMLIETKAFGWCSLITVLYFFHTQKNHSSIQRFNSSLLLSLPKSSKFY